MALDRPDAACVAELGRLEVDALGRWADGVGHLRLAVGLSPVKYEARAALAKGLTHLGEWAEATGALLPMVVPDPAPLLSLGDPAATLATLERAFAGEGRHEEAIVARELRAIAGGLDDGAHVELRARRLSHDPAAPVAGLFDAAALRASVVPVEVPALLLDVAAAIAGVAGKFARVDVEALGVTPRDRLTGHPLLVYRLAKMLGLTPPDVVVSETAPTVRVVANDAPWLVVPESLLAQPDAVQAAALVAPAGAPGTRGSLARGHEGALCARCAVRRGPAGRRRVRVRRRRRRYPGSPRGLREEGRAGDRSQAEEGAAGAGSGPRGHAAAHARRRRRLRARSGARRAARGVPPDGRSPGDGRRGASEGRGALARDVGGRQEGPWPPSWDTL